MVMATAIFFLKRKEAMVILFKEKGRGGHDHIHPFLYKYKRKWRGGHDNNHPCLKREAGVVMTIAIFKEKGRGGHDNSHAF